MNFISEIKKINTDGFILRFAERSIEMSKGQECIASVEIPIVRYGRSQKLCVALSVWDMLSIDYLAVQFEKGSHTNTKTSSDGFTQRKTTWYSSQNILSGLFVCTECGCNYRRIKRPSGEVV